MCATVLMVWLFPAPTPADLGVHIYGLECCCDFLRLAFRIRGRSLTGAGIEDDQDFHHSWT